MVTIQPLLASSKRKEAKKQRTPHTATTTATTSSSSVPTSHISASLPGNSTHRPFLSWRIPIPHPPQQQQQQQPQSKQQRSHQQQQRRKLFRIFFRKNNGKDQKRSPESEIHDHKIQDPRQHQRLCDDGSSRHVLPEFIELRMNQTSYDSASLASQSSFVKTPSTKRSSLLPAPSFVRLLPSQHSSNSNNNCVNSSFNQEDFFTASQHQHQPQVTSPNSIVEFRPFFDDPSVDSNHQSILWPSQDDAADDKEDATFPTNTWNHMESSDVYESPVGMLRVHSFPFLGQDTATVDDNDVDGKDEEEEEPQGRQDQSDPLRNVATKRVVSSSSLRRSMAAYSNGWDAKSKTFVQLPQPPPLQQQQQQLTADGFPFVSTTDSMDTEIMSNVTLAATVASATTIASTTIPRLPHKRKPEGFVSEKSLYASRKVKITANRVRSSSSATTSHSGMASSLRSVASTTTATTSTSTQDYQPQQPPQQQQHQPMKIYQILENVAERVSAMSLDASANFFGPACTAPSIDSDNHIHHDNNGNNRAWTVENARSPTTRSATQLLSCTGCAALADESSVNTTEMQLSSSSSSSAHFHHNDAALPTPVATPSHSTGSTPAGFHSIYSPNHQQPYYDYRARGNHHDAENQLLNGGPTREELSLLEECPSTEITLEATYPTKKTDDSRVMSLSEKCNKKNGDVIVKVAMLSNQKPTTSLLRKRQIVSGAKRWSAEQQQQQEETAVPGLMATATKDFVPTISASSDSSMDMKRPPKLLCQTVLSLSCSDDRSSKSSPSTIPTMKVADRWPPRLPSTPDWQLPSLSSKSVDGDHHGKKIIQRDCHHPQPQLEEEHCPQNNQTLNAAVTMTAVPSFKVNRISPVSIAEFS